MVENQEFQHYMNVCQPLIKIVSRNISKSGMIKIYDTEIGKIVVKLEKLNGKIALTTYVWTANHQRKGFIAHDAYVDISWTLQSWITKFAITYFLLISLLIKVIIIFAFCD